MASAGPETWLAMPGARGHKADGEHLAPLIEASAVYMRQLMQQAGGTEHMFNMSDYTRATVASWQGITSLLDREGLTSPLACEHCETMNEGRLLPAITTLVPFLVDFSQALVNSWCKLVTAGSAMSSEHPQQQAAIIRLENAGHLLSQLLQLWMTLCMHLGSDQQGHTLLITAASTVARLAAEAVPGVLQAAANLPLDSNEGNQSVPHLNSVVHDLANLRLASATIFTEAVYRVTHTNKGDEMFDIHQQFLQDFLLADGTVELLLLSLAQQAETLQVASMNPPAWMQPASEALLSKVSGSCATDTIPQQQLQHWESWKRQHQALLDSHKVLIQSLGSSSRDTTNAKASASMSPADTAKHQEDVAPQADQADVTASSDSSRGVGGRRDKVVVFAVHTLLYAMLHSIHASNNNSSGSSIHFPRRLVIPTVKVLLKVMLLLPSDDIKQHAAVVKLMLELLRTMETRQATATDAPEQGPAATAAVPTAENSTTWPVLPKAVAAGLLYPVVQLLSRVVLAVLTETQKQQRRDGKTTALPEGQVFSSSILLHHYGSLLMTVCHPVEPKHIAAAMKSNPLAPLIAIEAVIRAQTCQRQVHSSLQPQQQQQHGTLSAVPSAMGPAISNSSTIHPHASNRSSNITTGSPTVPALPPWLSLFAWQMTRAVDLLLHEGPSLMPLTEQLQQGNSDQPVPPVAAVLERVFTLLTTVSKMELAAAEQAAKQPMHEALLGALNGAIVDDSEPIDDDPNYRTVLLHEYVAGLNSITAVAAVLQRHCGLEARSLVCDGFPSGATSSSAANSSRGKTDCLVSSSRSYQLSRLWGLPAVLLLRMIKATVHHFLARQRVTAEFLKTLDTQNPVLTTRSLQHTAAGLHAVLHANVAAGISQFMVPVLLGMTSAFQLLDHLMPGQPAETPFNQATATTTLQFGEWVKQQQQRWSVQLDQMKSLESAATAALGHVQWSEPLVANGRRRAKKQSLRQHVSAAQQFLNEADSYLSQLQDFLASVLAGLPTPFCCNNPDCMNLSKLSEYQLVSGQGCVCGGCKAARYCSSRCQKKHWREHKQICQQMRVVAG